MRLKRAREVPNDGGFTLIELMITVIIMGVITVPLANLVISYFLNTATTQSRLSESHDEQIAATYWAQDVASIGVRGSALSDGSFPTNTSVNTPFACALPAGATPLIVLAWDSYDSSGTKSSVSVAYARDSSNTQLLRIPCGGAAPALTAVLAHNLDPTVAPYCDFDGGSTHAACTTITGTPSTLSMTLKIAAQSQDGQPYDVTLTGQRRQT